MFFMFFFFFFLVLFWMKYKQDFCLFDVVVRRLYTCSQEAESLNKLQLFLFSEQSLKDESIINGLFLLLLFYILMMIRWIMYIVRLSLSFFLFLCVCLFVCVCVVGKKDEVCFLCIEKNVYYLFFFVVFNFCSSYILRCCSTFSVFYLLICSFVVAKRFSLTFWFFPFKQKVSSTIFFLCCCCCCFLLRIMK